MTPYLKGIHHTLESWRPDRDQEGYKQKLEWDGWLQEKEGWEALDQAPEYDPLKPPPTVSAVPRLSDDVTALLKFLSSDEPATQDCRSQKALVALYLLGDASGDGLGNAFWDERGLEYEAGSWAEHCKDESSNWREAANLASKFERKANEGVLRGREVFLITDNMVFESTFYKGHSTNKKLNDIVFRIRKVEKDTGCILHIVHIAGTRMKRAGIDGLSRGDFLEGVMKGDDPLGHIPLNEDAVGRSNQRVQTWVNSWWQSNSQNRIAWNGSPLRLLTPEDWFSLPDIKGPRLWSPPLPRWRG